MNYIIIIIIVCFVLFFKRQKSFQKCFRSILTSREREKWSFWEDEHNCVCQAHGITIQRDEKPVPYKILKLFFFCFFFCFVHFFRRIHFFVFRFFLIICQNETRARVSIKRKNRKKRKIYKKNRKIDKEK